LAVTAALSRLRATLIAGAPLIAVTASSMPGDRERTLAAGFDGYPSKPITAKTFVREIERFLPVKSLARRK
jgi:two-component system, cell cycle response regulator DivK